VKYSQLVEQFLLNDLFEVIGEKFKRCLEFGGGDGYTFSNTRFLVEDHGWEGTFWDIEPKNSCVNKEKITRENINSLIEKYGITGLDLISIDIDGNDYWVWEALTVIKPRVVIIEYNSSIGRGKPLAVKYDPDFSFDECEYYGANCDALLYLAAKKGYKLVANTDLNLIFVDENECPEFMIQKDVANFPTVRGWKVDVLNREWVDVSEIKESENE
jgi:hypothetical protein